MEDGDLKAMKVTLFFNAFFTLVIACFNICGNTTVIYIFYRVKRIRNMNNIAVTLLAICGLLRGVIVMIIKLVNHFALYNSLIEPMCSITAVVSAFTFVYEPSLLALIAFIRYIKIVPWSHPFQIYFTEKPMIVTVLCLTMLSLFFSFLPFLGVGRYEYSIYHGVCFAPWIEENRTFRTIFYSLVFGLAFPVLTICYAKLYLLLKRHKNLMVSTFLKETVDPLKPNELVNPNPYKDNESTGDHVLEANNYNKSISGHVLKANEDNKSVGDHVLKANKDNESSGHLVLKPHKDNKFIGDDVLKPYRDKESVCDHVFKLNEENESFVDPVLKPYSKHQDIAMISHALNLKNRRVRRISPIKPDKIAVIINENCKKNVKNMKANQQSTLTLQEYNVTKLMILIFIAYCVCWLPATIVNTISLINPGYIPNVYLVFTVTIVELKSALNPIIYGLGNERYRTAFKNLIKKRRWSALLSKCSP